MDPFAQQLRAVSEAVHHDYDVESFAVLKLERARPVLQSIFMVAVGLAPHIPE
jgi:hypothetical protein